MTEQTINKELPISVPLRINEKNNLPAVELRKCITDLETLKILVSAAYHEVPIVIIPTFTDKLRSLGTLVDKGLLYRNTEDGLFYFTI